MRPSKFSLPALALLFSLVLFRFAPSASAQEAQPGDACPVNQRFTHTGGPENAGIGHILVCESGTWKAVLSFNGLGKITTLGNQVCATNEILKFNGSIWACAADTGGAETDPQVGTVTTSGNWCRSNGSLVNCDVAAPVTAETDPQVGAVTNSNWCRGDGSAVQCDQSAPGGSTNCSGTTVTFKGMACNGDWSGNQSLTCGATNHGITALCAGGTGGAYQGYVLCSNGTFRVVSPGFYSPCSGSY